MAILDTNLYFGTDLDCSNAADASPVLLGNVIDLGAVVTFPFGGETMYFVVTCTEQIITGGTAGTISFSLYSGPEAAITTTPSLHIKSHDILTDDATALATAIADPAAPTFPTSLGNVAGATGNRAGGILVCAPLPAGPVYQRYLGAFRQVLTTTTTAGKVDMFLTANPIYWRAFADSSALGTSII